MLHHRPLSLQSHQNGLAAVIIFGSLWWSNYVARIVLPARLNNAQESTSTPVNPNAADNTIKPLVAAYTKAALEQDSLRGDSIGKLLYITFEQEKARRNITDMKSLSSLQSNLVDSVSTKWYALSSKMDVNSSSYKKAYQAYQSRISEGSQKIMKEIYSR